MAYTEKTTLDLSAALANFAEELPEDQKEALNDLLTTALKAIRQPQLTGTDILSAGRTNELAALAARQNDVVAYTSITVTTVTTSLQSSRWLC